MTRGKVAGYYRISMEDDDIKLESNSITNQRILIEKFIKDNSELSKYEYCEFYDDGISGTTMDRPGIQDLLEKIKLNEIGCVIVKDLSRFSRDYIELGTYMEQVFPFMGIRFISVTDRYDSDDYIGNTVDIDIGFKSLLADFYCKDVSEKTKRSLIARKNQGKYATGNTPFGYMKNSNNSNELLIVPEEAEVIKYIFILSLSGLNLTQICKKLNDENILTPLEYKNLRKKSNNKALLNNNKYWQQGTVRAILLNESYIGNMVYNKSFKREIGEHRVSLKPREDWKVFENHHLPIIEKEIFNEVQKKFLEKKNIVRTPVIYSLKGKVYCKYCKRKLNVMKQKGNQLFFYCQKQKLNSDNECIVDSFSNKVLEKIVLEELKKHIIELVDIDEVKKEIRETTKMTLRFGATKIDKINTEISQLVKRKAQFLEEHHEGKYTKEEYMVSRGKLEQQIYDKREKLKELEKQKGANTYFFENDFVNYEDLLNYKGFTTFTKIMSDIFVDKIEMDKEKVIDIHWTFK